MLVYLDRLLVEIQDVPRNMTVAKRLNGRF